MHPRLGTSMVIAVSITLALAAPAFAFLVQGDSPSTLRPVLESNANPAANQDDGHPGCTGIANAFAHVSANQAANGNEGKGLESLTRVADKLGCDLALAAPIDDQVTDTDEDTDEPDANGPPHANGRPDVADRGGPPDRVVASMCDKITARLAEAQVRPHGKSAVAFARQAERWDCP